MRSPADLWQAVFDTFTEKLCVYPGLAMPKKKSIQAGDVPMDCEEFVVQGQPVYQGSPGQHITGYQADTHGLGLHSADVQVIIFRAIPLGNIQGQPPTAEQLTTGALKSGNDAQALVDTYWQAVYDDSIAPSCDNKYFGGVSFLGPQGGILGTILSLSVQLG